MSLPEAKHRFKPPFASDTDAKVAKNKDMPLLMKVNTGQETFQAESGSAKNKQGATIRIQIDAA